MSAPPSELTDENGDSNLSGEFADESDDSDILTTLQRRVEEWRASHQDPDWPFRPGRIPYCEGGSEIFQAHIAARGEHLRRLRSQLAEPQQQQQQGPRQLTLHQFFERQATRQLQQRAMAEQESIQQEIDRRKQEPPQRLYPQDLLFLSHCFIPTGNPKDIDLNSASQTSVPNLEVLYPEYGDYITLYSVTNAPKLVLDFKRFLFTCFLPEERRAAGMLRAEWLKIEELWDLGQPGQQTAQSRKGLEDDEQGWLISAPRVAHIPRLQDLHHSVLGLIVPGSSNVRWFYHVFAPDVAMDFLENDVELIRHRRTFVPGTNLHIKWHSFVKNAFVAAVKFPHSEDYLNARIITDCCPDLEEEYEGEAVKKLESCKVIYDMRHEDDITLREGEEREGNGTWDVNDDRYLEELPVAERQIASMVSHYVTPMGQYDVADMDTGRVQVCRVHAREARLLQGILGGDLSE
jgi:hypothetical protein